RRGLWADVARRTPQRTLTLPRSCPPGCGGAKPYHGAFERGVKLIGATSHYATEDLDEGPIIEQDVVRISHRDGLEDLLEKGRDLEKVVLSRAVRWHIDHRILIYDRKTVIFDCRGGVHEIRPYPLLPPPVRAHSPRRARA